MPALISSVERSSARGISDADGRRRCPFASWKERKPSRISAVVRTRASVSARASGSARGALRGGNLLLGGDLLANLLQRAPDQPRDVHLRDADLLRDLRLRQPLEEAQVKDPALALVEHAEARRQH